MATDTPKPDSVSDGLIHDARMAVIMTMVDTSARIFAPVIGLTCVGYGIDKLAGTRPVFVFSCLALGIVLSVLLVTLQYKKATRKEQR